MHKAKQSMDSAEKEFVDASRLEDAMARLVKDIEARQNSLLRKVRQDFINKALSEERMKNLGETIRYGLAGAGIIAAGLWAKKQFGQSQAPTRATALTFGRSDEEYPLTTMDKAMHERYLADLQTIDRDIEG